MPDKLQSWKFFFSVFLMERPYNTLNKVAVLMVFYCEIFKILKNSFFAKHFQWPLLKFNSCSQRGPEQKSVLLSTINTRLSWEKVFDVTKFGTSGINLPKGSNSWFFFYPFKPWSILDFAITKWFCCLTCFAKVFMLLFFLSNSVITFLS